MWHLSPRLLNKTIIGTNGVFRNQLDEYGTIKRNKSRLIVQVYSEEEEIDYDETFAPVGRIKDNRILIDFSTYMGFKIFRMYIKSVF